MFERSDCASARLVLADKTAGTVAAAATATGLVGARAVVDRAATTVLVRAAVVLLRDVARCAVVVFAGVLRAAVALRVAGAVALAGRLAGVAADFAADWFVVLHTAAVGVR